METLHMTAHIEMSEMGMKKRWEQNVDVKNQGMTEDGCSNDTWLVYYKPRR